MFLKDVNCVLMLIRDIHFSLIGSVLITVSMLLGQLITLFCLLFSTVGAKEMKKIFSMKKISTIKKDKKFGHGKKFALFIGIKAAKNDWLLLTDADCYAETNQWLFTMQKSFKKNTSFRYSTGSSSPQSKEPFTILEVIASHFWHASLFAIYFAA